MVDLIGQKKKANSWCPERLKVLSPDHKTPHAPLPVYLVIQLPVVAKCQMSGSSQLSKIVIFSIHFLREVFSDHLNPPRILYIKTDNTNIILATDKWGLHE